ncbi:MAG: BPSS1780 family membrane protein [Rubrivivax sp.]|nr:BPSS1780 family membrane protein [Rubrivivax sp.]MDP3225111.1 BPSS1780 family membrane protein [Rubrivivax sp.]MDP3615418.1 BPSS1780 family membrane protein [Rubrivivax sp.]
MALSLKTVNAPHGARWIADAWRLYMRRPLAFTALFAVFLFGALLVSLVPLLGSVVQMMALPLLSLGFMVASQSALLDGPVHPRQFIEPLRTDATRRRALLILCAIYGVAVVFILVLVDTVSDSAFSRLQQLLPKGEAAQADIDAILAEPGVATGAFLGLSLGVALSVPFWHAPALVHWGGHSVAQALFSSTVALWRCKGAFFVYAMGWVVVMVVFGVGTALLLSLLGLQQLVGLIGLPAGLMFSAVFYISLLFTFNDSFGGTPVQVDDDAFTRPDPG